MRPAPFRYASPETLDDALVLLAQNGEEPKVLAGGQTLIAMMNFRLARPGLLVDLRRIPELVGINEDQGWLRVGAMTTHTAVAQSPLVATAIPVMVNAARRIGHRAIRNRGTIGGSIAHADPAAEWPLVSVGLGARISCVSRRGTRSVAAADFFRSYFDTALEPDELITEVAFPALDRRCAWSFQEFSRQSGAFGLVLVIASAQVADDGTVERFSVCIGGCSEIPLKLETNGAQLIGAVADDRLLQLTASELLAGLKPTRDVHATSEDRRAIAHELVVRALTDATRARGRSAQNGKLENV